MMRARSNILLALVSALVGLSALAQHTGGDGGDPLELVFLEAQSDAVAILARLRPEYLPADTPERVKTWLTRAQMQQLAADVVTSKHLWVPDAIAGDTCARTNVEDPRFSPQDIWLSYTDCENRLGDDMHAVAVKVLIHEAVHHFGYGSDEERFCWDVAIAVWDAHKRQEGDQQNTWRFTDLRGTPEPRARQSAHWLGQTGNADTEDRLLIWGGCNRRDNTTAFCSQTFGNGALLTLGSDEPWRMMSSAGAPAARVYHSSVLLHDARPELPALPELIVWGGCGDAACRDVFGDGGIYDVNGDSWLAARLGDGAPQARRHHTAVADGKRMIVWGGQIKDAAHAFVPVQDGGVYDAGTGAWQLLPAGMTNAPEARAFHTAVVVGRKMIVWGGCDRQGVNYCRNYYGDGALLDLDSMKWTAMPTQDAPSPRRFHTAVEADGKLIVWGGEFQGQTLQTGGIYDPQLNKWLPTSTVGPEPRAHHTATWTGSRMLIWGGESAAGEFPQDVYAFDPHPDANSWVRIPTAEPMIGRKFHSSVWTGTHMIVWGGYSRYDTYQNTGGILRLGSSF